MEKVEGVEEEEGNKRELQPKVLGPKFQVGEEEEEVEEGRAWMWVGMLFGPPLPVLRPLPPPKLPPVAPNPDVICSCDVACDDWGDCCYDFGAMCTFIPYRPGSEETPTVSPTTSTTSVSPLV